MSLKQTVVLLFSFAPVPDSSPSRPPEAAPTWRERFKQSLPKREELAQQPWLAPIAERILDRKLWAAQHESVARGVAIGIFWAFVIPFAQIIAAAAHCVWWRANIPVAAAITFVTNPFTIGFWLYLAYKVGSRKDSIGMFNSPFGITDGLVVGPFKRIGTQVEKFRQA